MRKIMKLSFLIYLILITVYTISITIFRLLLLQIQIKHSVTENHHDQEVLYSYLSQAPVPHSYFLQIPKFFSNLRYLILGSLLIYLRTCASSSSSSGLPFARHSSQFFVSLLFVHFESYHLKNLAVYDTAEQ